MTTKLSSHSEPSTQLEALLDPRADYHITVTSPCLRYGTHNDSVMSTRGQHPSSGGLITMSTIDQNESIARRIFEEIWQQHNLDVIDELVAEEYVLHDPSMPELDWPNGREGYRQMAEMGSEMLDGDIELEQLIPAGEYVTVRWSQTGTHVGQMGSIEPTNEEVTVTGIEIDRFEDGLLVETWQEVNLLPMLIQIGEVPMDLFSTEVPADD